MVKIPKNVSQSADGAHNTQTTNIAEQMTVVTGFTPKEAVEIAMQIFRENFPKLVDEAKQIAASRAEEISNDLIQKLIENNFTDYKKFKEVDIQIVLNEMTKTYAREKNNDKKGLLIELVCKRLVCDSIDVQQVTINEAIITLGKLTKNQIKLLGLCFLAIVGMKQNTAALSIHLDMLVEIAEGITNYTISDVEHLKYTGCAEKKEFHSELGIFIQKKFSGVILEGVHPKKRDQSLIGKETDFYVKNGDVDITLIEYLKLKNPKYGNATKIFNMGLQTIALTNVGKVIAIFYLNSLGYGLDMDMFIK